jgi:dGTPase
LNAILKYPWHRRTEGPHSHKWGYYDSEEQDFKAARSAVIATVAAGDPPRRTLEAEIMDWADDITYSVHDVEDFYKAGKVPLDRILSDRQGERSRFLAWASADSTGDAPLQPGADTEVGTAAWADRTFFDSMILTAGSTEILRPYDGSTAQCAALKLLTSFLIGRYLGCRGPKPMIRLVPDGPQRFLEIDEALACEVRLLQSMMRYYVFEAPALVAQQHGHRRVVRELFDMLSENETLLPERFRPKEGESQARCVADLIASLTENQALTLHKRLAGLEPGSIHDSVL